MLHDCQVWALRDEGTRQCVVDQRCPESKAAVWWEHEVSNGEVCRRVLGADIRCHLVNRSTSSSVGWMCLRIPARCPFFRDFWTFWTGLEEATWWPGYDLA